MADKAAFRAAAREREERLSGEQLAESDRRLQERFLALPEVERSRTLLLFWSMGREVNTHALLDALLSQGKTVLLPRCLPEHGMEARRYVPGRLKRHRYGMWEPDESCERMDRPDIELILVPALCYDRDCFRMGRGGGYYDRYLAGCGGITVGLCRDALLCPAVPREEWDRPVDLVLTETEKILRPSDRFH